MAERCLQYIKDSNLKANHNRKGCLTTDPRGVYNISKIVI